MRLVLVIAMCSALLGCEALMGLGMYVHYAKCGDQSPGECEESGD